MSVLFRRELHRLAPYGLLGPLAFLIVIGGLLSTQKGWSDLLLAGLVCGPAILGIATVVPDTSSGGTTFFARLPISPGRVWASKLGASGVWLGLATVLAYVAIFITIKVKNDLYPSTAQLNAERLALLWSFPIVLPGFAYGAGLLASVIASRVMPAILLTPAVAGVGALLAGMTPAALFHVQFSEDPTFGLVTGAALGVLFMGASYLAFTRGQRHLQTPRPFLIAGAVIAPALLLWIGGVGVAQAWTAEAAVEELLVVPETAQANGVTAVPLAGKVWSGEENRIVVLGSDGGPWTLPERWVRSPSLSPDGKHLLVSSLWSRGGFLVDLTTKRTTPLPHGRSKEGFGFRYTLWRADGSPLLVEVIEDRVTCFDPIQDEMQLSKLSRSIRGIAGLTPKQALVVWDSEGIYALSNLVEWPAPPAGSRLLEQVKHQPTTWRVGPEKLGETLRLDTWQPLKTGVVDVANPGKKPSALPAGALFAEVVLSPTGRYALCRSQRQKDPLKIYDLHKHERVWERVIEVPLLVKDIKRDQVQAAKAGSRRFGSYVYGFSPQDRMLVVERWKGRAAVIDLGAGTSQRFDPPQTSNPGYPAVWNADGSQVVLPSGVQIKLVGQTGQSTAPPRLVVEAERVTPLAAWSPQGPIRISRLSPSQLQQPGSEGGAQ